MIFNKATMMRSVLDLLARTPILPRSSIYQTQRDGSRAHSDANSLRITDQFQNGQHKMTLSLFQMGGYRGSAHPRTSHYSNEERTTEIGANDIKLMHHERRTFSSF